MTITIYAFASGDRVGDETYSTFAEAREAIEFDPFLSPHEHCPDLLSREQETV